MYRLYRMALWAMVALLACFTLAAISSPAHARPAPESFADQVEPLMPAVVNISTTQKIKGTLAFPGDPMMDEQLREFFDKLLPPGMQPPGAPGVPGQPMEREAQSLGSGFIISSDGYIVTNNHVIDGATEIHVILSDNTKLNAEVIGHDSKTDVALLKVKTDKKLPYVTFGDSDTARVGDWVIAIGNPFGLGGSVTTGIISARARNINAGPFDDFIQTDASINRGNSGGPLFNLEGKVIGINTAIFSPSGGSIGIGFAVPSALAKMVVDQLKEHGRTFRGWLGVKIQVVTDEVAESLGMKKAYGALVAEVTPGGPAAKAGIKIGDVILQFDGKEVSEMRLLPRMVAETAIGKTSSLKVLRDGKERTLKVTLGELKEEETAVAEAAEEEPLEKPGMPTYKTHGMSLAQIDDTLSTRLGLKPGTKGVAVIEIEREGEAAEQGIAIGDIIQQVGDSPITTLDNFRNALEATRKSGRKHALLRIWRGDTTVFITLPVKSTQKG
jgi:serine protease Do